jgi:hypothetical protein
LWRCRSYRSLPLLTLHVLRPSPTLSLTTVARPSFYRQGDTTVDRLHARQMSRGFGRRHSPAGLCTVLSFTPPGALRRWELTSQSCP